MNIIKKRLSCDDGKHVRIYKDCVKRGNVLLDWVDSCDLTGRIEGDGIFIKGLSGKSHLVKVSDVQAIQQEFSTLISNRCESRVTQKDHDVLRVVLNKENNNDNN